MPVNMDPQKKRRRGHASDPTSVGTTLTHPQQVFGSETDEDREKDLADAESRNLWEATEVIDMDKV